MQKLFLGVFIFFLILVGLILLRVLLKSTWNVFVEGSLIGSQAAQVLNIFGRGFSWQKNRPVAVIGRGRWQVEIADDGWERTKGLAGRPSLAKDRGMLFIFQEPARYNFWMKGMRFPLDIVWIRSVSQEEGVVVNITEKAPSLKLFRTLYYSPKEPADWVLEINAGQVRQWGINVGDRVIVNRDSY